MRALALLLLLVAAGAGCDGSTAGQSCTQVVCAASTRAYQFCDDVTTCRYVTSDENVFSCSTCTDCAAALVQLSGWCAAGPTTGSTTSGNTTSGNTTSGSTTSGESCSTCSFEAQLSDGSCAVAVSDCDEDSDCIVLKSCIDACSDPSDTSCIDECYNDDDPSQSAQDLYQEIFNCVCEECASCASACSG